MLFSKSHKVSADSLKKGRSGDFSSFENVQKHSCVEKMVRRWEVSYKWLCQAVEYSYLWLCVWLSEVHVTTPKWIVKKMPWYESPTVPSLFVSVLRMEKKTFKRRLSVCEMNFNVNTKTAACDLSRHQEVEGVGVSRFEVQFIQTSEPHKLESGLQKSLGLPGRVVKGRVFLSSHRNFTTSNIIDHRLPNCGGITPKKSFSFPF